MAEAHCRQCGRALAAGDRFCAACGAAIAGSGAHPPPGDGEQAVSRLALLARSAKAVALLAFVLPWATISCAGQPLASFSGLDLALGTVTVRNPESAVPQTHSGSPELLVLLAAAAIGFAIAAGFLWPRRKAATAALAACGAAILLIWFELFVRLPGQVRQEMHEAPARPGSFDASVRDSMGEMVRIEAAGGFWLALLALLAAMLLDWLVRQRAAGDP